MKFKGLTESVIHVATLQWSDESDTELLSYLVMTKACILFKRNILDSWRQDIQTKNKLLSAFVSLFTNKYINYFIDKPPSKFQDLFIGETPGKYAPRLYEMKILENFTNRLSNFEDIVKYWDITTE